MRIDRLLLENFKCFTKVEVDTPALTLLTGLNGAGKSTVAQALLVLRQSRDQRLLPETGLGLNGDLVNIGTAQDALSELAGADLISFTIEYRDQSATWTVSYNPRSEVLQLSERPSMDAYNLNVFASDFQYLEAERVGPRPHFDMADHTVRVQRHIGKRGEYAAHFLHVFGNEKVSGLRVRSEAQSQSLLHQTEAWLSNICPGLEIRATPHPAMDLMGLAFEFVSGDGKSNPYRPTNVAFGLSYALPVVVAALSARQNALLILENPEAHLHPKAQSMIGKLLALTAADGVQLLVETHSDHLLNGVRLEVHDQRLGPESVAVNFFDRDEANVARVTKLSIDKRGRIDHWPGGFFDEWERNLSALLS